MLQELVIKNLAIIDSLTITFKEGLNVLTGETGAGKSIIVDSLGLALGQRASSDMIKHGADEGSVQALFEVKEIKALEELFPAFTFATKVEPDNTIILRRILNTQGKNRAYINDTLVNLSTLELIGKSLVDIHSQQEHQSLLNKEIQLDLLDAYGDLKSLKDHYRTVFGEVSNLRTELQRLQEAIRLRTQRLDLLRFQINEIKQAKLLPDEEELLRQEYMILKNSARLSEAVRSAFEGIYGGDNSSIVQISKSLQKLRELSNIDPGLKPVVDLLSEAKPLLDEASQELLKIKEKYELDPRRLDFVNERLDLIDRLKKKYGNSIEEILQYLKKAEEEAQDLEGSEEKITELEKRLKEKEAHLIELGKELSKKRKAIASKIEEAITKELKEVGFDKALFRASLQELNMPARDGMDHLEFEFSANPGEPPKPLSKVASGGELSRLMLCLKVILAEVDKVPVLIFDEVDAGIGGITAQKVAQRLKKLSRHRQVICITHLPQIASAADHHIKVEKIQKKDRVSVVVKALSEEERQEEIARMLSGKITDASLRHAKELIGAYK
jgi:DNA repair protein RecN (Recombination protein N)